ncbi:MAG: polysaccharide biosynthesis tyrosine autokinase [Gemmatimonadales bacterium]|nr:polysaccharide biosynthesis tyrosine autokinase [Gemmatimonadales bacterium]
MTSNALAVIDSGSGGNLPAEFDPTMAGPPARPSAPPEAKGGFSVARAMAAIARHKWLVGVCGVLGVFGAGLTVWLMPKEYTAQSTVWIETPPRDRGPIAADELLSADAWMSLLTTYAVLDTVALRQRLFIEPARTADSSLFRDFQLSERFRPGAYELLVQKDARNFELKVDGSQVERGRLGDSVGVIVGFQWQPNPKQLRAGRTYQFRVLTPRDASEELRKRLKPTMAGLNSNFLRISLRDRSPTQAAATLNAVLEQFVNLAKDLKTFRLREQSKTLEEQMTKLGEELRGSEERLEQFKTKVITQPREGSPIAPGLQATQPTALTSYFDLKIRLEELRRDRIALERMLEVPAEEMTPDQMLVVPAVKNSQDLSKALTDLTAAEGEMRQLTLRYTADAKPVKMLQERIGELRTVAVPRYARSLVTALRRAEQDMESRNRATERELQSIPVNSINEQRLSRDVASLGALYTDVQARFQGAKMAELSATPDVRVLDRAVPPELPSSNTVYAAAALCILGGVGIGVGLALVLDRMDKRFRYPDQVTGELGLPILGFIPQVRTGRRDGDADAAQQLLEAFRGVRLGVTGAYGAGPYLLTVSSPNAGDGKSFVAANLALAFAEAGLRTLLVDGDIRRGELHRTFKVERVPGLLDHLGGTVALDDILRPTHHANLTLLPSGKRTQRGPELLGSPAMREMMATLKGRYDVVLVDTPPLVAGVDPFILAATTGNLLLVLRTGETDRQLAEAKLQIIDRLPIRVLGAALNDVRPDAMNQYYTYYSYDAAYALTEEGDGAGRLTAGSAADA